MSFTSTQWWSDLGPFFLVDLLLVVQVVWVILADCDFQIVPQILKGTEIGPLYIQHEAFFVLEPLHCCSGSFSEM